MKRVVFVHGWYGHPADGWWPWLKSSLEALGFEIIAPQMPGADKPQLKDWITILNSAVGVTDKDTYFVGHSLGCITILKYLQQLAGNQQVGATILVAGFPQDLTFKGYHGALANFFDEPIEWNNINQHCTKFWVISSDNDPTVSTDNHARLVDYLSARQSWEHDKKHMAGDDGVFELPSALEAIKELSEVSSST